MSEQAAHFSFSNSLYDKCNIDKINQESTDPFKWITDSVYENKESCYQLNSPFMHKQFNNIPKKKVEIISNRKNELINKIDNMEPFFNNFTK